MRSHYKKIFISSIIILAFFTRLYLLDSIPPHPSLDEVSLGYNAYSILQTGKDEYGTIFPFLLRAYDDWRPALYVYLIIPNILIFDLSTLSVRLPSAILSLLSIPAVFVIAKSVLPGKKIYPYITAALFAASPWHIYISRLGHEVNLGMATFLIALALFFKSLEKKSHYIYLPTSAFLFAVSFSSYQSMKIFIPFFVLSLGLIYYKELLSRKYLLIVSITIGLLASLPISLASLSPEARIRFEATNIFSEVPKLQAESANNVLKARQEGDFLGELINNRRLIYPKLVLNAYASHLNPVWLFTNSGREDFKIPGVGLLHLYILPLLALSLFSLRKLKKRNLLVIFFWTAFALIPGAITTGYPHAMRTFQILPVFHLLACLGLLTLLNLNKKYKRFIVLASATIYLFSVLYMLKALYVDFNKVSYQFQDGLTRALSFANTIDSDYEIIYVDNKNTLFQSYMFYLFNSKYSPKKYLDSGGTISGGFAEIHDIGKYKFTDIDRETLRPKSLLIVSPQTNEGTIIKKIYNNNQEEVIWLKSL